MIFGLAAVTSAWKRRQRRNLLEAQTGLERVKQLSWQQFELLVGEIYRSRGYSVSETGGGGADGGVDLEARKEDEKFLIQCKHWKRHKVDVRTVREFLGVLFRSGAAGGAIVTTGSLTQPAQQEAEGQSIELIDGPKLVTMMEANGLMSPAELSSWLEASEAPDAVPRRWSAETAKPGSCFGDARNTRVAAALDRRKNQIYS